MIKYLKDKIESLDRRNHMEEKKEDIQMNMSLYDLNKNVIFNLPPQDERILNKNFRNINS